jgi:hypothetical protein
MSGSIYSGGAYAGPPVSAYPLSSGSMPSVVIAGVHHRSESGPYYYEQPANY